MQGKPSPRVTTARTVAGLVTLHISLTIMEGKDQDNQSDQRNALVLWVEIIGFFIGLVIAVGNWMEYWNVDANNVVRVANFVKEIYKENSDKTK